MRRACILRQLGRCAGQQSPQSPQCASKARTASRPLLRRELAGAIYAQQPRASFTTSSPNLLREENEEEKKQQWRLAPPQPPSVHPHPHHDATFDTLSRSEQLRTVMRLLPHSVVVCTSSSPSPSPSSSTANITTTTTTTTTTMVPRGMTMSSFTSLTLRPAPLVTFNIATPSRTLDAVAHSRRFNIHVLSGDAAGARVAEWFRRGNAEGLGVFEAEGLREGCGCVVVQGQDQKSLEGAAGGSAGSGEGDVYDGPPMLKGPGVLYVLRCRLLDDEPVGGLVRVRDHVLVVAEVVDMVEGGEERQGDEEEPFGLVYADRRYRQLGGTMVPPGAE